MPRIPYTPQVPTVSNRPLGMLKGHELVEVEKKLAEYAGDDRIISSEEMAAMLMADGHTETVYETSIPGYDRIMDGGVEEGELIVVSGPTGNGKTSWLMTVTKNLSEKGVKSCWFSFEVTPRQFFRKFNFAPPLFYLPATIVSKHLQWLEERIVEAKLKYDARVVFIDHLHFLLNLSHVNNSSLEIGDIVAKIKDIAVQNRIVIFLVAHPHMKKEGDGSEPHHDDIRDSGLVAQYADSIVMIWRVPNGWRASMTPKEKKALGPIGENDNKAVIRITKNRRSGKMGSVILSMRDGFFREYDDFAGIPIKKDDEMPSVNLKDLW